jgi:pimeloyl-ACP methyl ester carboxylesterase
MMTAFGNHIIALDYRGYGDSTGIPSVHGVVHDVLHVFKTIRKVCPDNPITIWGHSMGTGVALWTVNNLFQNLTGISNIELTIRKNGFFFRFEKTIWCCSRSTIL